MRELASFHTSSPETRLAPSTTHAPGAMSAPGNDWKAAKGREHVRPSFVRRKHLFVRLDQHFEQLERSISIKTPPRSKSCQVRCCHVNEKKPRNFARFACWHGGRRTILDVQPGINLEAIHPETKARHKDGRISDVMAA